jgi:hypothetical protein
VDEAVRNTLAFNFTASTYTATWQMLGQWYRLANESFLYESNLVLKAEAFTAILHATPWASSTFAIVPKLREWLADLNDRLDDRLPPRAPKYPAFLVRVEQEYNDDVLSGMIRGAAEINLSQNENQPQRLEHGRRLQWCGALAQGRKFGITSEGHMALLPPQAQKDDWICALRGIRLAFVLRTADEGRYRLIGPCYVHGEID